MAPRIDRAQVERARPDPQKRLEIPDPGKPGLFLVVQPSGKKSWAVRYRRRSDGQPRKYTLDGFPSLAMARKLAQEALDKVAEGGDSAADKKTKAVASNAESFEAVLRPYLAHQHKRLRPRSYQEVERHLSVGCGPFHKMALATIDRRAVATRLAEIEASCGPAARNRCRSSLSAFFAWCIREGIADVNPVGGTAKADEEPSRERVLTTGELAALWHVADADGYPFGALIKLLILTALRRDEARRASWREIDLDAKLWTVPAARSKNHRPLALPLSDLAACRTWGSICFGQ
jgi:integrase